MRTYLTTLILSLFVISQSIAAPNNTTSAYGATTQANAKNSSTNSTATNNAAATSQATAAAQAAPTSAPAKPQEVKQIWNLQGVDILKVIAEVSRETGKNFIVDPQVSGKITIVSSTPLTADEVYPVFLNALQVLGYEAVPTGALIKISPIRDASQTTSRVVGANNNPPNGDDLLVKVIPLQYVSAIQLTPILTPLIPSWAYVQAYQSSNSVIVSGTANVVNRISGIIARVDTPAANGVDVVQLQYADAEDLVKELEKLQQASRNSTGDFNSAVSADDRSNSILLSGSESTRLRYKVLISQLDVPTEGGGQTDTKVIPLHYKSVISILPVLRSIAHQSVDAGLAQATTGSSSSQTNTMASSSTSGSSSGPNVTMLQEVSNATVNAGSSNDKSGVIIAGDVPNNAVIITAPPNLMRTLRSVISQIDVQPKQVLVQGVIAEVDASKINELGIEWGGTPGTGPVANGTSNPFAYTANGMGVGFITDGNLAALITAISQDKHNNILSTPSIVVLNNGSANIQVGKNIPQITGSVNSGLANGNGGTGITNSYSSQNVGLVLSVIPEITDDNSVNMRIAQSNSTVIDPPTQTMNATTSQEAINTSVLVQNQQILVLGGLMNTTENTELDKVPVLGSIPLIGYLFQHKKTDIEKQVLLVFLRPVIINSPTDAVNIGNNKYDTMRAQLESNLDGTTPMEGSSVLPRRSDTAAALPVPFSDQG